MEKRKQLSRYEAPEADILVFQAQSGILIGSDPAEVEVVVPEVQDSGHSYDF